MTTWAVEFDLSLLMPMISERRKAAVDNTDTASVIFTLDTSIGHLCFRLINKSEQRPGMIGFFWKIFFESQQ